MAKRQKMAAPQASSLSAVCSHVLNTDWNGTMNVNDLAPRCCAAHGVPVRSERTCIVIDNVLSKSECEALVAAAAPYHEKEAPSGPDGKEPGIRSQFGSEDQALSHLLWERIHRFVPAEVDGGHAMGLETVWRHCRYWPGQKIQPHMDYRHGPQDDDCIASRISFTVYLNEDFEGGETAFVKGLDNYGNHRGEHYANRPRAGSAVLFYQCVPEFMHTGNEVRGGCKSIMRADVLYCFADCTAADKGGRRVE